MNQNIGAELFIPEGYDLVNDEYVRKVDLLSPQDIEKHIERNIVPFFKKIRL